MAIAASDIRGFRLITVSLDQLFHSRAILVDRKDRMEIVFRATP